MTVGVYPRELNEKELLISDFMDDDVAEGTVELKEKDVPLLHFPVRESAAVEMVFELPPNGNTGIRAAHVPV